jgi:alpha-methylacyl-CoA racemase
VGTLTGIRILEFAGIGPGPMAAMLLADMGATVLRLERPTASGLGLPRPARLTLLNRSRRSVVLDLKRPQGIELALALIARSDALIEGFRPGTMERLGLGPEACLRANPRLAYGRVTGWGQDGPLAQAAGHDLNYIALSGALDAIGREGAPPTVPLNLIGDYAGAAYLVVGLLAALLEIRASGQGQVIDAAMVDAATSLMTATYGMAAAGMHGGPRGTNLLDGGAPYYDVYECADGRHVSIAAIEGKFREELFERIGLDAGWLARSADRREWPALRAALAERFASRPRAQWDALLEGTDACYAPVLSLAEAADHPHQRARRAFVEVDGVRQPAPAPRFGRTPGPAPTPPETPGEHADDAMREWGFSDEEIRALRARGALLDRTPPA